MTTMTRTINAENLVVSPVVFSTTEKKSTYVPVEEILDSIEGLEDYLNKYIEALFGVSFEEFCQFHGGKQFSMFVAVSKRLAEDLNKQFTSWRLLNTEEVLNNKEIHAIISLTLGSEKHGVYQNDSVFYSNRFVELTLKNRAEFLKKNIENPPSREPGEGWNRYCNRLKNLNK